MPATSSLPFSVFECGWRALSLLLVPAVGFRYASALAFFSLALPALWSGLRVAGVCVEVGVLPTENTGLFFVRLVG